MKPIHVALLLAATTTAAEARVTRIEITKREPFAAGQEFGSTGAYEKIVGRYRGDAIESAHDYFRALWTVVRLRIAGRAGKDELAPGTGMHPPGLAGELGQQVLRQIP